MEQGTIDKINSSLAAMASLTPLWEGGHVEFTGCGPGPHTPDLNAYCMKLHPVLGRCSSLEVYTGWALRLSLLSDTDENGCREGSDGGIRELGQHCHRISFYSMDDTPTVGGMEPRHMVNYLLSGESGDGQCRELVFHRTRKSMVDVERLVVLLREVLIEISLLLQRHTSWA